MAAPSQLIGQTLGHYRILEHIGAGGMGLVYRAHDQQLERDVALKVLPLGTLADEAARKQFRKEALTLASLNHPNIETVFEFSTQDGWDFLVMELISGVSLKEKLKEGPVPEREVLRLGMRLAEGLAVAHEQGVIHRDLKPGNLMITTDGRVKILDFGLAKISHPEPAGDITISKDIPTVSGTVPYMSPEQLRGDRMDGRSDIFAAGTVLYEMTTGCRSFPQAQTAELIGAILHQAPAPLSSLKAHVQPALESVILKCLEKGASHRYQSARELLAALEAISSGITTGTGLHRARLPGRMAMIVAGAALAAVIIVALGMNVRDFRHLLRVRNYWNAPAVSTSLAPIHARRSVAVLGFKNISGRADQAWISTALSEMLTTELEVGEQLRTVPGENVTQMKLSLSLPEADSYGHESLAKIHNSLNADDIVVGSYVPLGEGQIRLDLRLQDAVQGEMLAAVSEKGSEAHIDDLVNRAGLVLREKLGASPVSGTEAAAVTATLPANPEAARLYSEGLAKLRIFDALGARDLLARAVALDPSYAMGHAALSSAWLSLGYETKAQQEAKLAFDSSGPLSREERLSVEGRYRETTHEWSKAIEIYRTLWQLFPDNVEYGLHLAHAQSTSGSGNDALATIETMRKLPAPAKDDPRIDLAEDYAADNLGDFGREQRCAASAAVKGESQGAKLMVARARLDEGWALERLGDSQRAAVAADQARELYAGPGDQYGVGQSLVRAGDVLIDQGSFDAARKKYEESLVIFRKIGAHGVTARVLNNEGNAFLNQGKMQQAKAYYEKALAIDREVGFEPAIGSGIGNIALVLDNLGDLNGARKMQEEALQVFTRFGDKHGVGNTLTNLGNVLQEMGELAEARRRLEEASAVYQEIGEKRGQAYVADGLSAVLFEQDEVAEARKKQQEALSAREVMGEKTNVAASWANLAALSLEEGKLNDAEKMASDAIREFEIAKVPAFEVLARGVLARALLAQGKASEAKEEARRALEQAKNADDRPTRLQARIDFARVQAGLGSFKRAAEESKAVLVEASRYGYMGDELYARLEIGEIELKSGHPASARTDLVLLEKDARSKGFLLVARKAAALTAPPAKP